MLHTEEIEYKVENTTLRGFLAYDKADSRPKPCLMIAPDWSGRSQPFCEKAKMLASQGYVALVVDMYGNAKLGNTIEEKKALLSPLMANRKIVTTRMLSAFEAISNLACVNQAKIIAMGYCFGGLCALDLARSGVDVKGVISFHGLLTAPENVVCKQIKAKILILHGYDDPMVPPTQVQHFAQEMTARKADWQIHMYGHTQHAFTNPEANNDALGLHYNKKADLRSWASAQQFLKEIISSKENHY